MIHFSKLTIGGNFVKKNLKLAQLNNYSNFSRLLKKELEGEDWLRISFRDLAIFFEEKTGNKIARSTARSYIKQMESAGILSTRIVDGSIGKQEIKLNENVV